MFRDKNQKEKVKTVVLRTTNSDYELNIIKTLLEQNKIPYIIRNHGAGGYMKIISGSSFYETDILVDILSFEKAKDILDKFPWGKDEGNS